MNGSPCNHLWVEVDRHENDDRVRARAVCANGCRTVLYGCFAKRVDVDGVPAWGPVGEWTTSEGVQ